MHDTLLRHVDSGRLPGLVALISRRGADHVDAIGTLAFDRTAPMRRDTIFRLASVTKPITAVAAMILVEECKLRLADPVDGFRPELANRRVLRTIDSELDDTVPARRAITVLEQARSDPLARPCVFESGAGDQLVSTADDLLAFGRMMLNRGVYGKERILSRLSVELMTNDHLTPEQKAASPFFASRASRGAAAAM